MEGCKSWNNIRRYKVLDLWENRFNRLW